MGLRLSLHRMAYTLNLPKDPQQIPAKNLPDVVRAISTIKQRLCDFWQIRCRVHSLGRSSAHAVKVGPQANMIHAGNFRYVIDMVDQ